jgi:hypothetical protein
MSIERDDEGQIKRLDWANITENIYKKADRLILAMPMVFNCGISREDVVHSLLEKFFASPDHLGWKPTKSKVVEEKGLEAGLISFLSHILAKRMIDQCRAFYRHAPLSLDAKDESGSGLIETIESADRSAESDLQFAESQQELIKQANGDVTIIGMIKAAPEISGSGNVDQELAELVFDDIGAASKIVNARKRFIRSAK